MYIDGAMDTNRVTNITINMGHRPGEFSRLGDALGQAGINIDGICAVTSGGKGTVHLLVADAGTARTALAASSIAINSKRDVLIPKQSATSLGHLVKSLCTLQMQASI